MNVRLYNGDKYIGRMNLIVGGKPEDCWVHLATGLTEFEIPIDFRRQYMQTGQRHFDGQQVAGFIIDRVEPAGRMNLCDVLASMGLTEYDPVKMFLWHKGKTVMDKIHIEL